MERHCGSGDRFRDGGRKSIHCQQGSSTPPLHGRLGNLTVREGCPYFLHKVRGGGGRWGVTVSESGCGAQTGLEKSSPVVAVIQLQSSSMSGAGKWKQRRGGMQRDHDQGVDRQPGGGDGSGDRLDVGETQPPGSGYKFGSGQVSSCPSVGERSLEVWGGGRVAKKTILEVQIAKRTCLRYLYPRKGLLLTSPKSSGLPCLLAGGYQRRIVGPVSWVCLSTHMSCWPRILWLLDGKEGGGCLLES